MRATILLLLAVVLSSAVSACAGVSDAETASLKTGQWLQIEPVAVDLPTSDPLNDAPSSGATRLPVLVNVWASFCGPCRQEMPLLQEADDRGDVAVVGLSRDSRAPSATSALAKFGVTFPNYLDPDAAFAIALDGAIPLNQVPATVLMVDGTARAVHLGPIKNMEEIKDALAEFAP